MSDGALMGGDAAAGAPLAGVRIVDAVRGPLAPITRYLADLGATVDRIVADDDTRELDGFDHRAAHAGKRRATGDAAALIAAAHAVVEDGTLDTEALRAGRPALVTMMVSDFGHGQAMSDWQGSDAILHALSGELCRSGIRGQAPLLPPLGIAYQCAASQGAYVLVTALYRALRTGVGDHIDFSALEGAVQALDPGFGIGGSATMGRPATLLSRDRPVRGYQYPIIPCADGHVRICLLAARQWQGMFRWMGEPTEFADPSFARTSVRYKSPELIPAIAAFFADKTRAELEEQGQANHVPIAALATLEEAIEARHFVARGTFRRDGDITLPAGVVTIDGRRAVGAPSPSSPPSPVSDARARDGTRDDALPFAGLRVIDLGVIVVGAETSRLFADGGADVVKIESRTFPDGNRQSYLPYDLSVSFAAGHRNKRSLGLDLRTPAGKALFLDMVARADVVLSNFKPGTMESLGFDRDTLAQANPRLVTVESSAFGATGPWSRRMGYGPLVRAATGLTDLWRYPGDPQGYSDSITIYPDHVAARVGAIAAVALLIRRLRSGAGGHAEVAQAEVMLAHFAADVARASAGADRAGPPDRPWGVYRAAGDDAWCVVSVRNDADWHALAAILGLGNDDRFATRAGRAMHGELLDRLVADWMAGQEADAAMHLLQQAGVPAATMLRIGELPGFAFYRDRGFFREERHPYLDEPVVNENYHARSDLGTIIATRPAPLAGEHSAQVLADWLGLDADAIGRLVDEDVVQPTDPSVYDLIRDTRSAAARGK